ncbi:MAG TPA: c-type cytochrome [Membranihabitans sp.]|nr:c-type cytochrome [Membranihabitans sp.]
MKILMVQNFSIAWLSLLIIGASAVVFSCNSSGSQSGKEIEIDLSSYHVADGYHLQSVAAEPQVVAPVDMIFDDRGRMWVVEMLGYMTDLTGSKEDDAIGQISILEDHDGNGVVDAKKIFLDQLVMPRSIAFAHGGLLYAVPPDLWWVPIENNDQPGEPVLVDSAYAVGGNVEHQPNGLMYNVDNWFYNAKSNARYRYRNHQWEKENVFARGQWGITQDEFGRLYYNNNSNQFQGDYFLPGIMDQNKNLSYPPGISMTIVKNQDVHPLQFTPVNRGYVDGVLDSVTHRLRHFTSASGPLYYTGHQYDGAFDQNSFVCGPEVNLIKRNAITQADIRVAGRQYYDSTEFVISSDPAFRPVSLRTGPDGWIYILDMHRGIIQHKTYMTNYLKRQYEDAGLDTVVNMGRILRILPEGNPGRAVPEAGSDLLELLEHPNSWQRIYAQQQIVENERQDLIPALKRLMENDETSPVVTIHAFWSLEGLGGLDEQEVLEFALKKDGTYFPHAIKFLTTYRPEAFKGLVQRIEENQTPLSEENLIYLAAATRYLSEQPEGQLQFLNGIFERLDSQNRSFALYMALSQYPDEEELLLDLLKKSHSGDREFVGYLTEVEQKIQGTREYLAASTKRVSRDDGLAIFETNCSVCHGRDGKGIDKLAPPLYQSPYLEDQDSALVMIALYGLQGPVEIGGQRYEFPGVMPGLSENAEYSDQEIAAVLSFIKNAFSMKPRSVSSRLVRSMRDFPPENGQPFTVESLENHLGKIGNQEN